MSGLLQRRFIRMRSSLPLLTGDWVGFYCWCKSEFHFFVKQYWKSWWYVRRLCGTRCVCCIQSNSACYIKGNCETGTAVRCGSSCCQWWCHCPFPCYSRSVCFVPASFCLYLELVSLVSSVVGQQCHTHSVFIGNRYFSPVNEIDWLLKVQKPILLWFIYWSHLRAGSCVYSCSNLHLYTKRMDLKFTYFTFMHLRRFVLHALSRSTSTSRPNLHTRYTTSNQHLCYSYIRIRAAASYLPDPLTYHLAAPLGWSFHSISLVLVLCTVNNTGICFSFLPSHVKRFHDRSIHQRHGIT